MRDTASLSSSNNQKKNLIQRLIIFSGGVLLLLVAIFFYQETETPAEKIIPKEDLLSSQQSVENLVPIVQVVQPQPRDFSSSVSLPANVSPWQQVTIYGKVSGYIRSMGFRVGDTVQKGEVMAVIEAPELMENFEKAQERYRINEITYNRLNSVWTENPDAIAKQDLDVAAAQAKAAKHLMENQRTLLEYTKIRAPFTGIVTGRFADPGILIQSATESNSHAVPLYIITDVSTFRIFVNVPQEVPQHVTAGFPVTLTRQDLGDWELNGSVTRTTNALHSETKTLLVEIDLPNKNDDVLIPGMLLTATFHFKSDRNVLAIPSQAIAQNGHKGSHSVLTVKGGQVYRMPIKTGVKIGTWTEVIEGLTGNEDVIVNIVNKDTITEGQKIQPQPFPISTQKI